MGEGHGPHESRDILQAAVASLAKHRVRNRMLDNELRQLMRNARAGFAKLFMTSWGLRRLR
jgi:uncharacterized protein YigA (DUF484 family)